MKKIFLQKKYLNISFHNIIYKEKKYFIKIKISLFLFYFNKK